MLHFPNIQLSFLEIKTARMLEKESLTPIRISVRTPVVFQKAQSLYECRLVCYRT